jgi:hypothetical protein
MDGLETRNTGLHVITIGMQHFSCEIDITCDFVKKKELGMMWTRLSKFSKLRIG